MAEHVLDKGLSWTGRAFVVDTWYLSQYDPIKDPEGNIIGMLYVGELEQKYLDLRTQVVVLYLAVIIGGMVLAFLTFFILTKNVLNPIQKLSEATKRLSSGDFSYRVPVENKDEIGVREEVNLDPGVKNPADFRLWQLNQPDHAMLYESHHESACLRHHQR